MIRGFTPYLVFTSPLRDTPVSREKDQPTIKHHYVDSLMLCRMDKIEMPL